MRCRIAHPGLTALVAFGLGACATPDHSNVLIFATNTKVALDVAVSPTTSAPEITVGYKRQEGVWMPLTPNVGSTKERTSADCANGVEKCGFIGTQTDGKEGTKKDAYSVLASFGAEFSSGASGSTSSGGQATASASGGLAQFFATGIAAQKLADKGGAQLVSVQSTDAQLLAAAEKRATDNFERATTAEQRLAGKTAADELIKTQEGQIAIVMNKVKGDDGKLSASKLKAVLDSASPSLAAPNRQRIERATSLEDLGRILRDVVPGDLPKLTKGT